MPGSAAYKVSPDEASAQDSTPPTEGEGNMMIAGPPIPGSPTDLMKAEEAVEGVASGDDGEDKPALAGMVRDPKTGEWVLLGELLLGESKRRKGFVIDPNSKWREKWDFFIMLLLLFTGAPRRARMRAIPPRAAPCAN